MPKPHMSPEDDEVSHHLEQVRQTLTDFKHTFAVQFIVSLSGGAEEHNVDYATQVILDLMLGLQDIPCAILTGGTQGGIPEIGTTLARQHGIPTLGVFPPDGAKYALYDQLDLAIQTLPPSVGPATFGSETPTFAQLADYAVFLGGAYGTLVEAATVLKLNAKRKKKGQLLTPVIPVAGSGGVADLIPDLVHLEPNLSESLPPTELTTGGEIADYIAEESFNRGQR